MNTTSCKPNSVVAADLVSIGIGGLARNWAQTGVAIAWQWWDRAWQRHHLLQLDDHLLKDIGLTRGDVEREAAKPFWKD